MMNLRNWKKRQDLYYPILADVEKAAEQLTGFKVRGHRMEIYGICPDCQKKDR